MKKLDLYWKSNREWWEYENHVPKIKESAPTEAKESFQNYTKQINNDEAL